MKIGIINYGSGNLSAFVNVFKSLDKESIIVMNLKDLDTCSHILMPGVSAWDTTMKSVENFRDALIHSVFIQKKPFLGVCVGMQILASLSEEGNCQGLNWINADVKKLPSDQVLQNNNFNGPKLPHMGWNTLSSIKNSELTKGLSEKSEFYFLHSYFFDAANRDNIIANSEHNSFEFPVIVQNENIFGVQFHPEKSHNSGKTILNNFAQL